jgi:hypothetical protein
MSKLNQLNQRRSQSAQAQSSRKPLAAAQAELLETVLPDAAVLAENQELERWAIERFLNNDFKAVTDRLEPIRQARLKDPSTKPISAKATLVLGVCFRRQELNPPSRACFMELTGRMAELMTENQLDVLDGLTACAIAEGNQTEASNYGQQAVEARAKVFTQTRLDWAPDWQEKVEQSKAGPRGLKVISYSLFGHKPVYTEMLAMSLAAAPVLFPGWQMRVYVDETVPPAARARLQASGAVLHEVTADDKKFPATTWRFLALEDELVEIVIFRDADSFLTPREVPCVQEWLESGAAVHAIRDWYTHSELILAGMWGARAAGFRGIRKALEFFVSRPFTPSHGDQHFLRQLVWPYAQHSAMVHDSVFSPKGSRPVPSPVRPTLAAHIGNRLSRHVLLSVPPGQPQIIKGAVVAILAGSSVLGEYAVPLNAQGKLTIELPNVVSDLVNAGQMKLAWVRAID